MNRIGYALASLLLMSAPAFAHVGPGAVHDFSAGALHPLSGLDHLLAAFAVGLWGILAGGRKAIIWPLTFVGVMTLATFIGAAGVALPFVEAGIAITVVALGVLLVGAVSLPTLGGSALIAAFAFVHGYAHGSEGGVAWPYLAGLVTATALLHGTGLVTAATALRLHRPALIRAAGAVIAVAGVVLLVA